jgi:CubicO group peptidase (beta-lactamase class C family)
LRNDELEILMRIVLLLVGLIQAGVVSAEDYFPARHQWASKPAAELGFSARQLDQAVIAIQAKAVTDPQDIHQLLTDRYVGVEPGYRILGPTAPRESSSGMIIRHGYIAAQWGDINRVDMTFSAVKSYLSTLAGLAQADGLLVSLDDRVGQYVRDGKFDSQHNQSISWKHLLQQTSDWQGSLWGTADWADRPVGDTLEQQQNRQLYAPGTHFKYNDVRVNLLAYSLLQVWRQPLPVVLRERVMDPIGASSTWRWHGYENSWVDLDGQRMQSVSGGGHFGGGLFISTADHARYGLLFLRDGVWQGQQILPRGWTDAVRTASQAKPDYGYMWWLNTDRQAIPAAPESAYFAAGFGGNYVYIDKENDLLVVLRWIPEFAEAMEQILSAIL